MVDVGLKQVCRWLAVLQKLPGSSAAGGARAALAM